MERGVAINNKILEEFFERLLRWGELCERLRELYYKYLDLAAFRSEKCYFPGRKCKRSWKREYDVDDLTLMWTYVLNTAPLCGRLIRALAEVEYKIRKRALESLEKYGGVEKRTNPGGKYEIVNVKLERPVHGYLALWNDRLYVIWGEFDGLSKDGKKRAIEIEHRVLDVIERHRRGESVGEVDEYEVDREYERLWLEVPLPQNVSKLLGGKSKAPIVLFRNIGWLLSDDDRYRLTHKSGNPGQTAARIFDWIAIATYAKRSLSTTLLVFKFKVDDVVKTKDGINPSIEVRAVGTVAEIIRTVYEQFGIVLNGTKRVIARGYAVLNALREESFKREGNVYVVDDVGAWIAFSATVAMLVLGDGYITPSMIGVTAKPSPETTFKGEVLGVRGLAKVLGGAFAGREARLQGWHMRLLLPVSPTPAFEKTVKLYDALVNYPAAATVEINGTTYLLIHDSNTRFIIGKEKAAGLYEAVKRLGLRIGIRKGYIVLTHTQLKELARFVPVRLLNELEKDAIREVKPATSPDLEVLRMVLEEVVKMARIVIGLRKGREYVRIVPYDESKLEEIAVALKSAGVRVSINCEKGQIYIDERRSVEAIRRIMTHLLPTISLFKTLLHFSLLYVCVIFAFTPPFYISFV